MEKFKKSCSQKFHDGHPLLLFELRLLGWLGYYNFFKPKGSSGNRLLNTMFYLYQWSICVLGASFIISLLGDIYAVKNNLIILGEDLCIIIAVSMITFKAYRFVSKCEDIQEMIHEIEMLIIPNDPSHERFRHRSIQDTFVFVEYCLAMGYHCLSCFVLIALLIAPSSSNNLPLSAWHPFDTSGVSIHRLMLAFQTFALIYLLISIVAMDSCTGSLWHQLSMQFEILYYEFKSSEDYCSAEITSEPGSDENSVHMNRLAVLIQRHQHLLTLAARMDDITSSMLTGQIVASNFIICFTGFEATLNETKALARFAVLLAGALTQLFLWCVYGEMIRSGSSRIAEAAFNTAWYKRDILSGSYSYFALLRNLSMTD